MVLAEDIKQLEVTLKMEFEQTLEKKVEVSRVLGM